MSKVALSGNASGTGTLTIAAPNTNTDRTLTLPDATGTVLVSGNPVSGTTGTFSGAVSGTTGTFSGAVSGTTGTFSGAVSGTTGTFSGAVSGTTGTFSGAVSGTTGTFSGAVQASGIATDLYPLVSGTIVPSTSGTSIDFTGIPSWVKRITVMFIGVSVNGASNIQIQLGSGSPTTTGYLGSSVALTAAGNSAATSTTGFVLLTGAAGYLLNGIGTFTTLGGTSWAGSVNMGQSDTARVLSVNAAIGISGVLDRVRITTVNGTDTFDAGSINILYE